MSNIDRAKEGHDVSVWDCVTCTIDDFRSRIRDLPVTRPVAPSEVRATLEGRYDFVAPIPLERLTAEVAELLQRWGVHVTHPRYFGLFNPSVHEAGIVAETLAALYNQQLAVWSHAPAANEIERLTLHHL